MNVLLISRAMVAASYRSRLRELARCGMDLTVIAPDRWENQKFEPGPVDGFELITLHAAIGWRALGNLAHHTFYFQDVSSVIRREQWDLIHIDDEPYNFATYVASNSCARRELKFVFTTWQNIMKWYPPPFGFFERMAFKRASGAIPGNREAMDVLRRRGFTGPAAVIPHHGVDVNFFKRWDASTLRRKLGVQDRFLIGYVGRVVQEKGIATLLGALARLPRACMLLIIGSGPARPRFKSLADDLGIGNRVCWIPWVPTAELPQYMNAIDVLVLPSVTTGHWKEQLGRVLIEAMACETCVVGSDSGEIPNVIGGAGLTFREADETDLADRLRQLSDDRSFLESFRHRGRQRVLTHFSDARVARDTAAFYRLVCESEGQTQKEGVTSEAVPVSD